MIPPIGLSVDDKGGGPAKTTPLRHRRLLHIFPGGYIL